MSQPNAEARLEAILKLLSEPAQAKKMHHRIALCREALMLVSRDQDPTIWADLQTQMGNCLARDPQGQRADNLERAIQHYEQAFQVFTREAFPGQWAMTQNNLAIAYGDRIRGDRANNLEQTIRHHERTLEVYTREAFPEQWAKSYNTLANAYKERILGERADNLEQAIHRYEQALEVYTREAFPEQWAATQNNLGNAYSDRIRGERADNLEQAIHRYEQALEVYTREAFPEDWASTQHNLGIYDERIRGERADNLEQAIYHYERALEVYTREVFPQQWAGTQNNLGTAYWGRIRGERFDNLEQAIYHLGQALQIYTREAFPEAWALTQHNLANAYRDRIRGERADNLEQAIYHLGQALQIYTREAFPEDWASTQNNLGTAYCDRIRGARADNLEQAIDYLGQALEIYTDEALPEQWAETQNNLGTAYCDRIHGERADNLEQAIYHYGQALEVYTREAFPEDWGSIQNNLGIAYIDRIRGERADNLEQAIYHLGQALEGRTREAFPEGWALTKNNLGSAYSDRIRGERADNLEQAIYHLGQALQIYTREAFPEQWALTQNNLGIAYRNRIRGERADNLEQAIYHYGQALEVYTREAFPEDRALSQHNLALTYNDRIRGVRADNLVQAIHHFEQALEVFTREAFPARNRDTKQSLGSLHFDQEDWERSHASYSAAIQAGADLLGEAYTETGRRAEVGESARLYANDAFALFRLGQFENALLTLEQGKTRLLNEALATAEADLAALPVADQQALRAARQAVRELEAEARLNADTPARRNERDLAAALRQARADLKRLVEKIRAGQPEFLPIGLDLPALLALIPKGGALVAPFFTPKGSAAFVVPHGCTTVTENNILDLNTFTDADLQALLQGRADDSEVGGWLGAYGNQKADPQRWLDAIEAIGGTLWNNLMGPVYERLSGFGLAAGAPVLLMPQGGLGLLPMHAAWRKVNGNKRYFLDDFTVSYAPSGYALGVSFRRLGESSRSHRSLLAVVNPTGDLPFSLAEGRAVTALFSGCKPPLEENKATGAEVVAAAPGCNYLHFSCHGFYHWHDAMQSGLVLAHAKPLTLAEIISKVDLRAARLVTLSACETGLSDIRQSPDEYLGLPAGFLQAGTPAVLSTLWSVENLSTRLLIERFYLYHLKDRQPPAIALRHAQIWLRDSSAKAMALADQWQQVYQTTTDQELKRKALWGMRYCARQPEDKPFSSPYYWAPFTVSGV